MRALADWLSWQEAQHPQAIDLGLERVFKVWKRLGEPRPRRVVTVAGTNGKGSTVYALDALARSAGWACGRYTSPHIHRYNERVAINGKPVADALLCDAFERIHAAQNKISLTYFEYGTLAAILLLTEADVDLAVLEVGLGGRLDATNVIDADMVVLCSISRDHEEWLGSDLSGIAREKAGVARAGRPAIVAQKNTEILYRPWLEEIGALMVPAWSTDAERDTDVTAELPKDSLRAAKVAADLLSIPLSASRTASVLSSLRIPGRMERRSAKFGEYLLDVAHNPAAAERLAARINDTVEMKNALVIGMQADKDLSAVANALAPHVDRVFAASLPGARGASSAQIHQAFVGRRPVEEFASPLEATRAAESWASTSVNPVRIIIAGSFVTVGSCGLG